MDRHGALLRAKEQKPTTSQHGAEKDQLSVGERKPTTAARIYDLFEQVRETMWGEADCPIDAEPVDKMRDDYALCVVAREAAELKGADMARDRHRRDREHAASIGARVIDGTGPHAIIEWPDKGK